MLSVTPAAMKMGTVESLMGVLGLNFYIWNHGHNGCGFQVAHEASIPDFLFGDENSIRYPGFTPQAPVVYIYGQASAFG